MKFKNKDYVVGIWITSGITFAIATLVPKDYWMIIWTSPIVFFVLYEILVEIFKKKSAKHSKAKTEDKEQ